jgi:hypothetical protein
MGNQFSTTGKSAFIPALLYQFEEEHLPFLWRISVVIPSYPFHTTYSKHLLQAVTLCHTLDVIALILFRLIRETKAKMKALFNRWINRGTGFAIEFAR